MTYSITEEEKKKYAGVYLLEYIINKPEVFPVFLEQNDSDLEPILENLMVDGFVEIKENSQYIPTQKGREALETFIQCYYEFLNVYDLYAFVDLQSGNFAFEEYLTMQTQAEWESYIDDDRWDDMRIAVASYLKIDPIKIVFMQYITEGRFGRSDSGWQFDLLIGSVWDEILDICNSAIQVKDLGYEDDLGKVDAEDVIRDIITQGSQLMIDLHNNGFEYMPPSSKNEPGGNENDRYVDEVNADEKHQEYWEVYEDPFYVAPAWRSPWWW